MTISSLPEQYSSAYAPALFNFVDADPAASTVVEITDDDAGDVVGRKRFIGTESFGVDVAPYARRLLNPMPQSGLQSSHFVDSGRSAAVTLSWEDDASEQRVLTPALRRLLRYQLLCSDLLPRRIARNECDEISYVTENGDTVVASVTLFDGASTVVPFVRRNCITGIGSFCVAASHLVSCSPTPNEVEGFKIRFGINNVFIGEVTYELAEAPMHSMRLCWLNSLGCFDYHTFSVVRRKEVHTESRTFVDAQGNTTTMRQSALQTVVASGDLPSARLETLAAAASSPHLCRIDGQLFKRVTVVDSECLLSDRHFPCGVSLTLQEHDDSLYRRF